MFGVGDPATAAKLARVMDELARYLSTRCESEQNDAELRQQARQLRDDLRRAVAHSRRRILDIAKGAHAANGSASTARPGAAPGRAGLPAVRLRRVLSYIDASLAEPLTVRSLACVAGMSPSHFTMLFKRSTGLSPYEVVQRRRISRAKELLHDPSHTIAAIGCQLGFSSQAHFTTVFRRRIGVTPSAYRLHRAPSHEKIPTPSKISENSARRPVESESLQLPGGH
jgi:AraC-like DNA-binding protein